MSVMKKMMTLLRGSVREIGESVVDANATRICEQEILDAKHHIAQAKEELVGVMATEMQSARQIARLQEEIVRHEKLAVEALDASQAALAEEVAAQVGALDLELQAQTRAHASCAVQAARLKALIRQAETRVREHERELAVAKTTESVYRATRSISDNDGPGGSRLVSARESLERMRQRHEDLSDRMTAADQLHKEWDDGALEQKLAAAGLGDGARRQAEVMERIRARRAASADTPTPPSTAA
ncbi:MAG: phage shock protein A [Betaproteobacteria bacterium HGW-Betaproteobacteria-9]|jgi:phage shock protein A|nr:MAG: phage shock protein A [Betaproteobacteria bacterium HGW-Betaproteobacteria-9]